MEDARAGLPATPPGGVTAGVDGAGQDHVAAVAGAAGEVVTGFTAEHAAAGLAGLVAGLRRAGAGEAAIERPDGQVAGALPEAGFTVVVISPNQVRHLRSRYGPAGSKEDRFDAFVPADVLRTGRHRLRPLPPDSPATVTLRQTVRARKDLAGHRVAAASQLRAPLAIAFPGAAGLSAETDSPVSLAFLARFDCQDRAGWLPEKRLAAWPKATSYRGRTPAGELHRRLTTAPRGATGHDGTAAAGITRALAAVPRAITEQIKAPEAQIAEQLALHADARTFTPLPRAGTVRAARMLAETGDCRARFPAPEALTGLAGVAPSTRKSGKIKIIAFRRAADRQLRGAACDFASDSRRASPWAASTCTTAIARGKDHPHAGRILARARP